MSRYIKRKRVESVSSYLPPLLAARDALAEARANLADVQPAAVRELLRSGPFDGIRDSVRAVGEFAEGVDAAAAEAEGRAPTPAPVKSAVRGVFSALEGLDALMFRAERSLDSGGPSFDLDEGLAACDALLAAFDGVTSLVDQGEVMRARSVVDALSAPVGSLAGAGEGGGGEAEAELERLKKLI